MTGTLHEDLCKFIMTHCTPLRIRNVSDKSCRENQNTHSKFNNFSSKNHSIIRKNIVETDGVQMPI